MKESKETRVHNVCFHLYKTLDRSMVTESRSVVASGRSKEVKRERLQKGHAETFGEWYVCSLT